MNGLFIYVFDENACDQLLSHGYNMLKRDDVNHVYIFLNDERQCFTDGSFQYALSDTLTF